MDARTLCAPIKTLKYRTPTCVESGTSAPEVIDLMQKRRVGCILVVREGELVGIVTDRDLLLHIVGKRRSPEGLKVEDIMTASPETLRIGDPIAFAVNLMRLGRYRHIPLVAEDNMTPVGYISTSDIVRHVASSIEPGGAFYVPVVP